MKYSSLEFLLSLGVLKLKEMQPHQNEDQYQY